MQPDEQAAPEGTGSGAGPLLVDAPSSQQEMDSEEQRPPDPDSPPGSHALLPAASSAAQQPGSFPEVPGTVSPGFSHCMAGGHTTQHRPCRRRRPVQAGPGRPLCSSCLSDSENQSCTKALDACRQLRGSYRGAPAVGRTPTWTAQPAAPARGMLMSASSAKALPSHCLPQGQPLAATSRCPQLPVASTGQKSSTSSQM